MSRFHGRLMHRLVPRPRTDPAELVARAIERKRPLQPNHPGWGTAAMALRANRAGNRAQRVAKLVNRLRLFPEEPKA